MRLLKQAATFAVTIFALAVIAFAATSPAFAQDGTIVSVPWGEWVGNTLGFVGAIIVTTLGGMLTWAARLLPAAVRAYITDQMIKQVEQLLKRAIDHGINSATLALEGRELSIDVRHKILADALHYVFKHGPAKLIEWMGGTEGVREKIEARLPWQVTAGDLVDPVARHAINSHGAQ